MIDSKVSKKISRFDIGHLLMRARYKYIPDHLIGEVLSKKWVDSLVPFAILVASIAIFGSLIPGFFGVDSLVNSTRQLGEFGFVVLAMMVVIVAGGIDLSVGSNFALGNFVALALMSLAGWPVWAALPATVLICGAVGMLNGVLVGLLRLRAFLTTLVTLILIRAVVDLLLQKYSVPISGVFIDDAVWDFFGGGKFFGAPFSAVLLLIAVILGHIILTRTRPGWRIMAVGGSRRSAHNSGISVRWTVCGTYVVSGLLVGLAGFMYASRLSSASSGAGFGLEVAALTGAILGGNSVGGGRGSTSKALMGAIVVLLVTNGVVRLGMSAGTGSMVLGLVLLLAAAIDVHWVKNRHKLLSKVYVSPTYVDLPPLPETAKNSDSPYALNDKLRDVDVIGLDQIEGPEDVILDRDGNLYCGTRFGEIMRFRAPDYKKAELFADTGGYPFGMAFNAEGTMYVCLGGMGLYRVSPEGVVSKATDETNRSPFSVTDDSRLRLADDLDIAPDGRVFFSEATTRYDLHDWPVDALEGRGNGRIICYDPKTNKTKTVLHNLVFPNGICTSQNGQSILFAETWACRIRRYWFDGPKKGQVETVISNLPGYPDNINRASDGKYWVAIVGMRTPTMDLASRLPSFRKRMSRRVAFDEWLYPNINTGCVIKFTDEGEVLETLWDLQGTNHPMITSMREHKGSLFLGGVSNNRIGRFKLEGADPNWTGPSDYWGDK